MPLKSWEELSLEEKLSLQERMVSWADARKKRNRIRPICKIKNIAERFFLKVVKTEYCWIWKGFKNKLGYGDFSVACGIHQPAHRVSWLIHYGDMNNLFVLHKCDNPSCVNPEHLFLGTQSENCHDRHRKGRTKVRTGPRIMDEFTNLDDGSKKTKDKIFRMRRFRDGKCATCGKPRGLGRKNKKHCILCNQKRRLINYRRLERLGKTKNGR